MPLEWTPSLTEWNGRRGAVRPPEWRKTPGGAATEWGRGIIVPGRLNLPWRGREVESSQDDSTLNGGGGGVESWQDDSTLNTNGGGVESSWDDLTPREAGTPKGVETLGAPTASRSQQGEDRQGRGGEEKNPPTTEPNREQPTDGGDDTTPRGVTAMEDAEAETGTEKRSGDTGSPKEHPIGADAAAVLGDPAKAEPAPTEEESNNGAGHPTPQTMGAAPAASAGGTVRAGPALASGDAQREEGGDKTPRRAQTETKMANEATEERVPPEWSRAPYASGRRGGERRGRTLTQQCTPMVRSEGAGGDPREAQRGNPPRGGPLKPEWGPPARSWSAGPNTGRTATRTPPKRQPAPNASGRRGGGRGRRTPPSYMRAVCVRAWGGGFPS